MVFLPGAARVASHGTALGAAVSPGAEVLEVTGTTRLVSVDLDARRQGLVKAGDAVDVELPDGTVAKGTVTRVGTVAEAGSGDGSGGSQRSEEDPTIDVTVALDDASAAEGLDGAPVEVRITSETREGVLAVPVNALVALAEGGYAVEVDDGGGSRRLVRVETGLYADGLVEVEGSEQVGNTALAEGARVVVPTSPSAPSDFVPA